MLSERLITFFRNNLQKLKYLFPARHIFNIIEDMISVDIPGFGQVSIRHLVCDYSGTLSVDGILQDRVKETLNRLAEKLEVHIITADTHGKAKSELNGVDCKLVFIEDENQHFRKKKYISELGAEHVFAVGNGKNDKLMLKEARFGIAICLDEGVCVEAVNSADILVNSIDDALGLLLNPNRLKATLRF